MPRSVNHVASRARRKKVLKLAKGYFGRRKNVWTVAKNAVEKGLNYAYRDRRVKKREFRSLWIVRINAACRIEGISYSQFMGKLNASGLTINRKVLADLAMNHPEAFKTILTEVINGLKADPSLAAKPTAKVAAVRHVPISETRSIIRAEAFKAEIKSTKTKETISKVKALPVTEIIESPATESEVTEDSSENSVPKAEVKAKAKAASPKAETKPAAKKPAAKAKAEVKTKDDAEEETLSSEKEAE